MKEPMERAVDEMEQAYLDATDGDARDALRRALGEAMMEMAAVSAPAGRGFIRADKPVDLARKMSRERRARQATR